MMPEELDQIQKDAPKEFQPPATSTIGKPPNINKLLFEQYSNIDRSLYFFPTVTVQDLSPLQQQFVFQYSGIHHSKVISILTPPRPTLQQRRSRHSTVRPFSISFSLSSFRRYASVHAQESPKPRTGRIRLSLGSLRNSLLDTLAQVKAYLPPDERRKCETIVIPHLKRQPRLPLTLSESLALLSLLVSIFFGVASSMPDEQIERIIAQNETIIQQQAEIAQLQEDKALVDALCSLSDSINSLSDEIDLLRKKMELSDDSFQYSLSDSINRLTDEVELLREDLKSANDSSDVSGQTDDEESQQQNSDTQN